MPTEPNKPLKQEQVHTKEFVERMNTLFNPECFVHDFRIEVKKNIWAGVKYLNALKLHSLLQGGTAKYVAHVRLLHDIIA